MTAPQDANGFSLAETLVALAIAALLASLASLAIRQAAQSRDRVLASAAQFEDSGNLRRVLDRTLGLATPPSVDAPAPSPIFVGTASELRFAAPLPLSIYSGGPGAYGLGLNRKGDWLITYKVDAASAGPAAASVFETELEALDIAYFGPISPNRSDWRAEWSRRRSLPQLVRFQWRKHGLTRQLIVRPLGARLDCSASVAVFDRSCLE